MKAIQQIIDRLAAAGLHQEVVLVVELTVLGDPEAQQLLPHQEEEDEVKQGVWKSSL